MKESTIHDPTGSKSGEDGSKEARAAEQHYSWQDFDCIIPEGGYEFNPAKQSIQSGKWVVPKTIEELVNEHQSDSSAWRRLIFINCVTPSRVPYVCTLEALLARLYSLCRTFVYKHQSHYYKQYRGDLLDLAADFYIEFITSKSRSGRKECLIDKYNPAITSFEYLVKRSVIRMLIDRSRGDSAQVSSIESLYDEFGDFSTKALGLVDGFDAPSDGVDDHVFSPDEVRFYRSRFLSIPSRQQARLRSKYAQVRTILAAGYRDLLDRVMASGSSSDDLVPEAPQPSPVISDRTIPSLTDAFSLVLYCLSCE